MGKARVRLDLGTTWVVCLGTSWLSDGYELTSVRIDLGRTLTLGSTSTSVLGHFGPRSLLSFFQGPKWPRTKVTKDRIDSVTSVLRTDLSIEGPIWTGRVQCALFCACYDCDIMHWIARDGTTHTIMSTRADAIKVLWNATIFVVTKKNLNAFSVGSSKFT